MSHGKRLVAVLNWREGGLVKSNAHSLWRPSLRLDAALRVLDRWQVDEIVLLDISRTSSLDGEMLEELSAVSLSTPLAVGGGIRSREDVERALQAGADRVVLESLLLDDDSRVREIIDLMGRQGVIGSLPVMVESDRRSLWRQDRHDSRDPVDVARQWIKQGLVSEVLVKDVVAEGCAGQFASGLSQEFRGFDEGTLIWFGGLDGPTASELLECSETAAVAFGNILSHSELAAVRLRKQLRRRAPGLLRHWSPA
jgi:cyclase